MNKRPFFILCFVKTNMTMKSVGFLFSFCNLEVAGHMAGKVDLFVLGSSVWNSCM